MVVKYRLPSSLQHGDAVELQGRAGNEKMIVDLLSDHSACDPGKKDKIADPDDPNAEDIPMTQTQPLQIVLETVGTWDVNASSPFSSTSSHGTTAKRFGFRPGEQFVCTIVIRPEHFEIRLNEMPFASSEHLVPVGSIHGIQFDGDASITGIRFGHPMAIEQYNLCSPHPVTNAEEGVASIVECRMAADETLQEAYRRDSTMDLRKIGGEFSKSTFELFTPVEDRGKTGGNLHGLPGLQRATSYQLVFDLDESDAEDRENVANLRTDRRTKSQFNLCCTALSNQLINMDGDAHKPVIKLEDKKNSDHPVKNRTKRAPSSLARKVNGKLAENLNEYNYQTKAELRAPKLIKRPIFHFDSTDRFGDCIPGFESKINSRHDTNHRAQTLSFGNNGTQVGTEVKQRPVYKATLPYEVERLEQISDEDSISYVPVHRVVFRRQGSTLTNSNKMRGTWNGVHGKFSQTNGERIHERDPRRATYTAGQVRQSMIPVPIRSPLTLLDQQWDQILPVISHKPESTGVNSVLSTDNTISSNSEENRPPYVHWYEQMKQKSSPVSMIICDDSSVLPPIRTELRTSGIDFTLPSDPKKAAAENLGKQKDRNQEPEASSVMKSGTEAPRQINGNKVIDAPDSLPKLSNGSVHVHNDQHKTKIYNQTPVTHSPLKFTKEHSDDFDEPVLLIDCIPMDDDICVVQQPVEAWPAKATLPEMPQVLKSWGNRLNLQLESRTFSEPTEDLPDRAHRNDDDDELGDNTESLLSELTMHTEYGNMSTAFDEVLDQPVHSIHDPRSPENRISEQLNEFVLMPSSPKGAYLPTDSGSVTPHASNLSLSFLKSKEPELPNLAPPKIETPASGESKTVSNTQRKQTPSDFRQSVEETNQPSKVPHKTLQTNDTVKPHATQDVTANTEKKSNVSKLFRGFQGRRSFLGGKAGLKFVQKSDPSSDRIDSEKTASGNRHSTPVYKSNASHGNHTKFNGSTNVDSSPKLKSPNDNIKQFVQSPKRWFSKKLNGVKS